MRILPGPCKLVEALAEWGLHEAEGRLRGTLAEAFIPPAAGPGRAVAGVELALRYRAPYVARILQAGPLEVLKVEFEPEDRAGLFIADGKPLPEWSIAISTQDSDEGRDVLGLAQATPVDRHLVCAAHAPEGNPHHLEAPIVIYDGWHRGAAWFLQMESGQEHVMAGHLILTRFLDPALAVQRLDQ